MTISRKSLFLLVKVKLILLLSFVLLGCQAKSYSDQSVRVSPTLAQKVPARQETLLAPADPKPVVSNTYASDSLKLQQCQAQLDALQGMGTTEQYKSLRASFDYLMNGAAQYGGIRQKVSADTQDTVDSLYRYRANLLCSQIEQSLLNRLTNRGEARP